MIALKVLVVGSGGREHALCWKFAQSARVHTVFAAPGNGGTAAIATNVPISDGDVPALVRFAQREGIDLVFVGPEGPLVAGLVDALQAVGIRAFGPSATCARLEGSKAFSKAFMDRTGVPTARWRAFTDEASALKWLAEIDFPVVVKASGLAAGKGVVMPADKDEAAAAVRQMFDGAFGDAGHEVVLEELLIGEEASLLAFCDGADYVVMPPAQDHKRVGEGDTGPNTGGMGAYAPAPIASEQRHALAELAIRPILEGFLSDGTPYTGILYAGLMLTAGGLRVLEYNCRFGDPETQVILPLLETDLVEVIDACLDHRLGELKVDWHHGSAATVVCASEGYPGNYPKGRVIMGLDAANAVHDVTVFHAGTKVDGGHVVTSGGRVLTVTGVGSSLHDALAHAYAGVDKIHFQGLHARRDIGHRALKES